MMENDLLGTIDARRNNIALEEAKRRLVQLERDIQARAASDAAEMQAQEASRDKAIMEMEAARQLIDNLVLRAPISGIVTLTQNLSSLVADSSGVIYISSAADIPTLKQGDTISP